MACYDVVLLDCSDFFSFSLRGESSDDIDPMNRSARHDGRGYQDEMVVETGIKKVVRSAYLDVI